MAKSDKTDKPEKPQTDSGSEDKDIVDAEVVKETTEDVGDVEQDENALTEDAAVTLDDPEEVSEEVEETTAEAEAEPVPQEEAPVSEEPTQDKLRSSGAMPLVIAGVVTAGIGFGAASYLGSQGILFGGKSDEAIAELSRKLADQADLVAKLQSNQDKIADTANAAQEGLAGVEDVASRTAALSERLEALGIKVQSLEGRVIEVEKRPMTEGASSSAIEAYEREVEQLRAMVAEQLAEAENLKQSSVRTAQGTMAQAALTRVVSAVDSGASYRVALTELASVSEVSIPDALSAHADEGVATNLALVESFPDYARAALADARKQEGDSGNRFSHFLKSQLGARSTEPREGTDADAVLSRSEAALREGRLEAALQELSALPDSSQALMADWRVMAESRLAVLQAVETLAQSLNSN